MSYANNKGTDQSAHPRRLISTFVVRCLDSMICILATSKDWGSYLASVVEQGWFESYLVTNPEDRFSRDKAQLFSVLVCRSVGVSLHHLFSMGIIWATSWENLFLSYANNKDADQPAHPRSLISVFVIRCLDSIIFLVSISEIQSLYRAAVAAQAGLILPWSQIPKTGFLVTRLMWSSFW